MMKLSIYNTDEENLFLVPNPTGVWISCEILRCSSDETSTSSNSPIQYEVWKISHDADLGQTNRRLIGSYDFLREAFERAHHIAAESKNIKDLSESLKDLEGMLGDEEEALEALERELTNTGNDKEFKEYPEALLMAKVVSRSIN